MANAYLDNEGCGMDCMQTLVKDPEVTAGESLMNCDVETCFATFLACIWLPGSFSGSVMLEGYWGAPWNPLLARRMLLIWGPSTGSLWFGFWCNRERASIECAGNVSLKKPLLLVLVDPLCCLCAKAWSDDLSWPSWAWWHGSSKLFRPCKRTNRTERDAVCLSKNLCKSGLTAACLPSKQLIRQGNLLCYIFDRLQGLHCQKVEIRKRDKLDYLEACEGW